MVFVRFGHRIIEYWTKSCIFSQAFFVVLVAVDSPVVEINGDRLNVEWSRPLQANQGMRLKYKVKVDVGEHKSFSSGELDSIYYSYPC